VRLALTGLVAGFFAALFGVGGGIVVVPMLMLLCALRAHVATATSLAAIGITALAGAVTYAIHGEVHPWYAVLVGVPAAVGAIVGTTLAQRVRGHVLSYLFALFLVVVAVALLV
jgi:uncharacterized membrane protein YfcA